MAQRELADVVSQTFTEFCSKLLVLVDEIDLASKDVLIEKENFAEFALIFGKIRPILKELKDKEVMNTPPIRKAIESLEIELKRARALTWTCKSRSQFYLLLYSRTFVKQIEDVTHDLGRCLGLVLLATLDVSIEIKAMIGVLHKEMLNAKFDPYVDDTVLIQNTGSGFKQENGRNANQIFLAMAKAAGVSLEPASLKHELEELKKDRDLLLHKTHCETVDLDQIITYLSQADFAFVEDLSSCERLIIDVESQMVSSPLMCRKADMEPEILIESTIPVSRFSDLERSPNASHHPRNYGVKGWQILHDIDAFALQLRTGNNEEFSSALLKICTAIEDKTLGKEFMVDESFIPILLNRLGTCKHKDRMMILLILRSLASENDENREKIADGGTVATVVRSLTRDAKEGREAVRLLLELSEIPKVRQRVGRVQGCIVSLVAMLNSDDPCASNDAKQLLDVLSSNTQNVLHMAEASYFMPLVQCLQEGSEMNKILMATALSRMELTDQSRATLGDEGSIQPLVKMFTSGKLEAKLSSLGAIQRLSTLTENVQRLIDAGIIAPLLQLLFSVTSVLMTLREPASAILASIAQSESILVNKEVAQQMLSLLNLSSPVIQCHLLRALNSISSHPSSSKIRAKMKENGAIQLLLPFLTENNTMIRTGALNLLHNLSNDCAGDLTEQLGETHLIIIASITSASISDHEKAAAIGILANISIDDKKATEILKKMNLLPILVSLLGSSSTMTSNSLLESVVGVLVRFTVPWDKKLQRLTAELGAIPLLVKLLSTGTPIAKSRAATCLAQLSQSSLALSNSKLSRWLCISPSMEAVCKVHGGYCSVKTSFCLLKAGAISPLAGILESKDREAHEAALGALATIVQDDCWESGSNAIAEAGGVQAIIKVLEVESIKAQERAVWILERVFRIEPHREKHGDAAQVLLIGLAQNGDPSMKPVIAKVLALLQLLQNQSSYF